MTRREMKQRIRELEKRAGHEAYSLTRLYTRVERLEARLQGAWTIPLKTNMDGTLRSKPGENGSGNRLTT